MALHAPESKQYPLPDEGSTVGVLADVEDLGVIPGFEGKPQHTVKFVFQVEQETEEGERMQVQQRFNFSSNEKAKLRLFLEAWRGKNFASAREMSELDLEKLVGANGIIN